MTTQAATIGGTGTRPRAGLEALVDRLMAALLGAEPETAATRDNAHPEPGPERPRGPAAQAGGRSRRGAGGPRRRGRGDGGDTGGAVGLRRVGGPGAAAVRRPQRPGLQPGSRAGPPPSLPGLTARWRWPRCWGCAGSRARSVSRRSLRGLRPLKREARHGRSQRDGGHPGAEGPSPPGGRGGGVGGAAEGKGQGPPGRLPLPRRGEGSFTVYADTERWYCFGCGLGGDVLDFVQRAENLSLPEAVRRLDGLPDGKAGSPGPGSQGRHPSSRDAAPQVCRCSRRGTRPC